MALCGLPKQAAASETTVVAEAQYLMADGDTLTQAEDTVLQRAKRKAVEEAGMYLESTFLDVEKTAGGKSFQTSSLEIRTIAAAVTKTEVLELRRSFDNDRPSFYIRIRAAVDLEHLQEAIRRRHSEQLMAENFRRLQKENSELKTQLKSLKATPAGVRTLTIELPGRNKTAEQAQQLVDQAITTPNLLQKIELASQAAVLDPRDADPLVVRGQTYLKLASAAYSNNAKPSDYSLYVDNARMDFDRALIIDPQNTWALLGQGDVNTWLRRHEDAGHSYEQALALDPLFDIARHRLSTLYTTEARKLAAAKRWEPALTILRKLLDNQVPDRWVFDHKEAYLLRSDIYQQLNQPGRAIEDLSVVLRVEPADTRALRTRAKLYRDHLQGHLAKNDLERACMLGSKEACQELP